jgi:hypothetical protein
LLFAGGCWLVFKAIGELYLVKSEKDKYFVDKSVHYHKHYTKEDQHLHVIDEKTKSEVEYHE